jgi:hypothetical protein
MVESSVNLVQGLQGALAASQFGGMVCLAPTAVASPATLFTVHTLYQLADAVKTASPRVGESLLRQASVAAASRDPGALHKAWRVYAGIVSGRGAGTVAQTVDPVTAVRAHLASGEGRLDWAEPQLKMRRVPPTVVRSTLEWLGARGAIGLDFVPSGNSYFTTRVAERSGRTVVEISIPNTRRVITEGEINALVCRAIATAGISELLVDEQLDAMQRVDVNSIGKRVRVYDEIDLVRRLIEVLGKERFLKHIPLVPIERGLEAAFAPTVLTAVADAIAREDVNLGATLSAIAKRASATSSDQKIYLAWVAFVNAMNKAKPSAGKALVDVGALASATEKLEVGYEDRRQWLLDALVKMRVPNPDALLDEYPVLLGGRQAIYVEFAESGDERFSVSADLSSSRNYITVMICVPAGLKVTSEEQIRYLVARALIVASARFHLPDPIYDKCRSVSPEEIKRPVKIAVMSPFGTAVLGPIGISAERFALLVAEHSWLRVGSSTMNSIYNPDRGKMTDAEEVGVPSRRREPPSASLEKKSRARWSELARVPGIEGAFLKPTAFARMPGYSFLFEVDDALRASIGISMREHHGRLTFIIRLSSRVMNSLRRTDMVDILVRAADIRSARTETRRSVERFFTLAALGDVSTLPPERRLGRSLLMATHELRSSSRPSDDDVHVDGNVGEGVMTRFATVVDAVSRFHEMTDVDALRAAWSDVLAIRRWYLYDAGLDDGRGVVDVIPLGGLGLVHIHSHPSAIDPGGWLYVMSAVAANPGSAFQVATTSRSFMIGREGDSRDMYGSIAANPMFQPFGVYDPAAQMPERAGRHFPGGELPEKNPHYATATAEKRQDYIRALRWFATAGMPEEWKPRAGDTLAEVRRKYRAMQMAWHPDRNHDVERANLLKKSGEYWDMIFKLYGKK